MLDKFIQGVAEGFVKEAGKEVGKQLAKGTVETTKKFIESQHMSSSSVVCSYPSGEDLPPLPRGSGKVYELKNLKF